MPRRSAAKERGRGAGLAARDLRGAEDMRVEQRQEAGHRECVPDAVEMAVRGDAAPRRQRGEEFLDARYRLQLALEGDVDLGAHRLEEPVRQRAPKPGLDRGSQGQAVLAKAEDHGLLDRRRKIGGDQALAENAPEYDLAVDQHTVAIEDDESGHERSLSAGWQFAKYMAPDIVVCHL